MARRESRKMALVHFVAIEKRATISERQRCFVFVRVLGSLTNNRARSFHEVEREGRAASPVHRRRTPISSVQVQGDDR